MTLTRLFNSLAVLDFDWEKSPEFKHVDEDELLCEFVRHIASNPGDTDITYMARAFVKFWEKDRTRWYA